VSVLNCSAVFCFQISDIFLPHMLRINIVHVKKKVFTDNPICISYCFFFTKSIKLFQTKVLISNNRKERAIKLRLIWKSPISKRVERQLFDIIFLNIELIVAY